MGTHCRVELLGQLRAQVGETVVTRFRTYKTGSLLALLAYRLGQPVPREELVEMLWPDSSEDQARNSLSQSISSLRHQFEPPGTAAGSVLDAGRHAVRLTEEACTTDLADFRTLVSTADKARVRGDDAQWEAKAREAVALFRGEFLPGIYEDWTLGPREHVREEALETVERLVRALQERGDLQDALTLALQGTVIDPTRESCHQAAIAVFGATGRPEAAMKQYRELERALYSQLGLKPSDSSKELVRVALQRERAKAPELEPEVSEGGPITGTPTWVRTDSDDVPEDAASAGAGIWRFGVPARALAFAERALQRQPGARCLVLTSDKPDALQVADANEGQILGDEATAALLPGRWTELGVFQTPGGPKRVFATTATAERPSAMTAGGSNLPASTNRFFGRESELARIRTAFGDDGARIVTLTGTGGIGKSRLSLEAARAIGPSFPAGTAFVRLEDRTEAEEIWTALAGALGITPAPKLALSDQVCTALSQGRRLLVLDNFEQLVGIGGREVLDALLSRVADVALLVSSRRLIGLEGEFELAVPPLATPGSSDELADVAAAPSVALFLDRAKVARPDFQLTDANRAAVVQLCIMLDGIPLALELAAARSQVLTPAKILERIEQALDLLSAKGKVERHRSLRAAMDWTVSLLDPSLSEALGRLSVFRGGWYEPEAEAVLGSAVTLDVLADLREFSLVTTAEAADGSMRFGMLETVRTYARQLVPEAESEGLHANHAAAVTALCERSEPLLEGMDQMTVLDRLDADRANIRAAVEWACGAGDVETALRICGSVWRFWHLRAHLDEGRALSASSLAVPGGSPRARARTLNGAGRLAYLQGEYARAEQLHTEALGLAEGDDGVQAMSLNALGAVSYETGRYDEAVGRFQEALALRLKNDDGFGAGNALSWLGIVYTDQSRYDEALEVLEESLAVRKRIGDLSGIARSLNSLGIVSRRLGDLDRASALYAEALEIQRGLGDKRAVSGLISNLAMIAQAQGRPEEAARLLDEASEICRETGDKWGVATVLANQATLALDTGSLKAATGLCAKALAARYEIGNWWGVAFSLESAARCLAAHGHDSEAVGALCLADRVRKRVGSPLPPADKPVVDATASALRERLGGQGYDSIWDKRVSADLDESIATVNAALERLQ